MPSAPSNESSNDWELFAAIRKEELAESLRAGRVQIVNVLTSPGEKVIPSTRHIPLKQLETRLGELDRTWPVIVYCQNRDCPMSREAARLLAHRGFHVRPYEGGIEEWIAAGLATEAPKAPAAAQAASPPTEGKEKSDGNNENDADAKADADADADADAKPDEDAEADAEPADAPDEPPVDSAVDEEKGTDGSEEGADDDSPTPSRSRKRATTASPSSAR